MNQISKSAAKTIIPGPCHLTFDYRVKIGERVLSGNVGKLLINITKPEQLTEEDRDKEILEIVNGIIEQDIAENPSDYANLNGRVDTQIDVSNIKTAFLRTELTIDFAK